MYSGAVLGQDAPYESLLMAHEITAQDKEALNDALFLYELDADTEFTQPIALARYLSLIKTGKITNYVKES